MTFGLSMRCPIAAAFLLLCACPARAEDGATLFGVGIASCATWTPSNEAEVGGWVFGFWSALNIVAPVNHTVGQQTDARGVLAEVRRQCNADPSKTIEAAISDVYAEMRRKGR